MLKYQQLYYPETRFGGYTNADEFVAFYTRIRSLVDSDAVVLDIGCGRGAHAEDPVRIRRELKTLKGACRKVIGIDVDRHGVDNPQIDEFRMIDGARWPLADNEVDVAFADSVLEHVPDPAQFFAEAHRVLKPGGYLCIKTPNVLSYFGLAARIVPDAKHAHVLPKVQGEREEQDVFPKYYRCNTIPKMRRALKAAQFDAVVYGHEPDPKYLSFSRIAYAFGVLHQRLAPRSIQNVIFAFAQKR